MRQNLRNYLPSVFLLIILILSSACEKERKNAPPDPGFPKEENKLILKIEETSYFNSDFQNYLRYAVGADIKSLPPASLSRLMDNFIEDKILLYEAKRQKINLTWEEKKKYLAKFASHPWPNGEKISLDEVETNILFDRLLIEKFTYELIKEIDVEEEEVSQYYEEHKEEFLRPERVKVSQILFKNEEKAIETLKKLKNASEENFREVARRESLGVEAWKGGEMGVYERGQLPFEMEGVVFSLKEGELSPVLESSYGYHIFRLDKRYEPELISLEEATPEIKIKLLNQKIRKFISDYLNELKENLEWTFYPQNLSFAYSREEQ